MDTVAQAANKVMGTPYRSIGAAEHRAAQTAMYEPLSGYLAGKERGGYHVQALEDAWCETFGVKHAIACNSATSGMMAAAFAAGLQRGDKFSVSPFTMSATAAAPMMTGAEPIFSDVDDQIFAMSQIDLAQPIKAAFVTNLFGHPGELAWWKRRSDDHGFCLIEDNAQAPFATEDGKWAGTIGHIGVFSLNVHKHFQCGEGGAIVTDSADYAAFMRRFINHGEHAMSHIGLNLRMPEICAAIALAQLRRGPQLVGDRVTQAMTILDAIGEIPGIRPPVIRDGCRHVFYTIPFTVEGRRRDFCMLLTAAGVPIVEGYQDPLYRMPAFKRFARSCPIAEDLQDRRLFYIENCAWTFSKDEIRRIGDAFKRAAEAWM